MNELTSMEKDLTPASISEVLEKLVLMLEPFAPYVVEEMWEQMGRTGPVFRQPWPEYDPELAKEDEAEIPVQVNGKLRARIVIAFGSAEADVVRLALSDAKVQPYLDGKQVIKTIYVPDRLVNIVVK
jgi:leucyl-tRNA synthetase